MKGSDFVAEEPDKTSTPVESISQLEKKLKQEKGFNMDLVSRDERVQDQALKDYYKNILLTSDHKQKILACCVVFSRQVKPVIAVIFVISYWSAGIWNYHRLE